jgi:hypothetical protein
LGVPFVIFFLSGSHFLIAGNQTKVYKVAGGAMMKLLAPFSEEEAENYLVILRPLMINSSL